MPTVSSQSALERKSATNWLARSIITKIEEKKPLYGSR